MSDLSPVSPTIILDGNDCAVVFHKDGTMNIYVPSREEGEAVPRQMLLTLLVQEMFKDPFMMKVLTDRLLSSGVVGSGKSEKSSESATKESIDA